MYIHMCIKKGHRPPRPFSLLGQRPGCRKRPSLPDPATPPHGRALGYRPVKFKASFMWGSKEAWVWG